jgi:hypothetical protein
MTLKRFTTRDRVKSLVYGACVAVIVGLIPEPLRGEIIMWAGISFLGLLATGLVVLFVVGAVRRIRRAAMPRSTRAEFAWQSIVEDRLDELERLKRRDMVTPEEYAAKRQEILKDL